MKILWLSHFLPYPPKGGALQRSHNLLLQAARRHEVHLVSLNNAKILSSPGEIGEAVQFLKTVCATVQAFPIPSDAAQWRWAAMTAASYFRPTPYDVNWLRNREMQRHLETLSRSDRFDLVHLDTVGLCPYGAAFPGTPLVLNHHNVESHMMRRRAENEAIGPQKLYFRREASKLRRYERNRCPECALNLVVSELDGARLKETVGDVRVSVVPNGVDMEYFQSRAASGRAREGLIFAGGMDWYPNREAVRFFLKEIWPMLLADGKGRRVTFLGKHPPRELIEAAKDPSIRAPGFVDDVRPYLDEAAIYICPIRDGGGTRLKILDALAMEKPLVATGLAVEGLDLKDGVHYLKAETAGDFARTVRRLEDDVALRQTLGAAGQRFVRDRFSWNVIGRTLIGAYQDAIVGGRSVSQ